MSEKPESHMYTDGVDIRYHRGRVSQAIRAEGQFWYHSEFCQCHLERKLRGKPS